MPSVGFLKTAVPLSLGIALVPAAVRWGYLITLDWRQYALSFMRGTESEVVDWFEAQARDFEKAKAPRRAGILLVPLAATAFFMGGAFADANPTAMVIGWVVLVPSAYAAGVGLGAMAHLARFLWRAGTRFPVRVEPHSFGVLSQGRLMLQVYLLACAVWFVYTLSAAGAIRDPLVPLVALALPSIALLLGTFFICQLPTHRRMVEDKRDRLQQVRLLIDQLAPRAPEDLTADRIEKTEHLMKVSEAISALPEWPVGGWGRVTALAGSFWAVSPTILGTLMEYFGS